MGQAEIPHLSLTSPVGRPWSGMCNFLRCWLLYIYCLINRHFISYCHRNLWHGHISSFPSDSLSPWCKRYLTNPTWLPITLRSSSESWSCRVSLPMPFSRMSHQPLLSHSVNPALQPFSSAHNIIEHFLHAVTGDMGGRLWPRSNLQLIYARCTALHLQSWDPKD
jgi:hypothetical protein